LVGDFSSSKKGGIMNVSKQMAERQQALWKEFFAGLQARYSDQPELLVEAVKNFRPAEIGKTPTVFYTPENVEAFESPVLFSTASGEIEVTILNPHLPADRAILCPPRYGNDVSGPYSGSYHFAMALASRLQCQVIVPHIPYFSKNAAIKKAFVQNLKRRNALEQWTKGVTEVLELYCTQHPQVCIDIVGISQGAFMSMQILKNINSKFVSQMGKVLLVEPVGFHQHAFVDLMIRFAREGGGLERALYVPTLSVAHIDANKAVPKLKELAGYAQLLLLSSMVNEFRGDISAEFYHTMATKFAHTEVKIVQGRESLIFPYSTFEHLSQIYGDRFEFQSFVGAGHPVYENDGWAAAQVAHFLSK
jgi:hypothetical protein